MISYTSMLWVLFLLSGLLLVLCGILLWMLGNQSGRTSVQIDFDDYVSQTAQLAIEAANERTRLGGRVATVAPFTPPATTQGFTPTTCDLCGAPVAGAYSVDIAL